MDYVDAAKRIHGVHGNIAADVWPKGAALDCRVCHKHERITTAQCALYLRTGWPKCCGQTMALNKKAEAS